MARRGTVENRAKGFRGVAGSSRKSRKASKPARQQVFGSSSQFAGARVGSIGSMSKSNQ